MPDAQSTTVFFCRHGETDWNLAKRFQGSIDIPLNDQGGTQAQDLAEVLRPRSLAAVWSSHLSRARLTAAAIAAACETELTLDDRLRERELGVLQGCTAEEIKHRHPEHWRSWKTQSPFQPGAGVEQDAAVIARVEDVLFECAATYPGKSVAIVGHGAALRCVLLRAVGTASISTLVVGPGRTWRVVKTGDESHLTGLRGLGFFKDADYNEWGADMTATTVLLCRHGETDWNLDRRFQGTVDIPLNALGLKQAGFMSEAMKSRSLSAVWTSPLERAKNTGEVIAQAVGVPLILDDRLRERNLGVLQGRTPTELRREYPAALDAWIDQVPLPKETGAETAPEVVERIESALFDLAAAYPGKIVALILHGASIRCLLKRAVGTARITTPKNVSISTMIVGPGKQWRLERVSDVSHMPKETRAELLERLRSGDKRQSGKLPQQLNLPAAKL